MVILLMGWLCRMPIMPVVTASLEIMVFFRSRGVMQDMVARLGLLVFGVNLALAHKIYPLTIFEYAFRIPCT
jgi:hypothetical protein